MVSADNLNYDVLGMIFSHLVGNDLVAVSLVSRSFNTAVIPKIYRTLFFRQVQAKKYPRLVTPFAVILSQPYLATHVRSCDILALPLHKGQPHAQFLVDCVKSLQLCTNLTKFICAPHTLLSFLTLLSNSPKLRVLKVNAALTSEQASVIAKLTNLEKLWLDHASPHMLHVLPRWAHSTNSALTELSIMRSTELNMTILRAVLSSLPNLTSLQVLSCIRVDHGNLLNFMSLVPNLRRLAFSVWENCPVPSGQYTFLSKLQHLVIDTRETVIPFDASTTIWSRILGLTKSSDAFLQSLTLKLSSRQSISDDFISRLISAHGNSLRDLRLLNCELSKSSLSRIAEEIKDMEIFSVAVNIKNIHNFAMSMSSSRQLHTLVNIDLNSEHAVRPSLTQGDVETLSESIPSLRSIISEGRCWIIHPHGDGNEVTLDRIGYSTLSQLTTVVG